MKPRPASLASTILLRQGIVWNLRNLQCLRCLHQQPTFLPPFHYRHWHDNSRSYPTISTSYPTPGFPLLRYASTSTAAAAKSPSSLKPQMALPKSKIAAATKLPSANSSLRPIEASEKLNPPRDTYAPELNVPEQKPGQGKLKRLYHTGRAYVTFYKGGIANVRSTAALAKQLRAKAQGRKEEDVLTRAEWQIVRRSKGDMLRLPAFGLLVLIFGEWLPVIALYLTPVIPEPCRIPTQTRRALEKLEKRRREREGRLGLDAARLLFGSRKPGVPQDLGAVPAPNSVAPQDVGKIDLFGLLTLSTKLDAHSKFWDWLFMTPPKPILRWGLRRKLEYLRKDDALIRRDGGWQGLGKEEGTRACIERGINVLGKSDTDLRKDLAAWFAKK